jgi:AcrR family transcriptional regulator
VREAVTEAILEAAEAVAVESGLEAASAAAIATRAGVAVGTLYNYFPDREGIFAALFKTRRAAMLPGLEAAARAAAHLPFEGRVRSYITDLLKVMSAHQRFLQLAVLVDDAGAMIRGRDKSPLMSLVTQHLEDIMRQGASRKLFAASRAASYARLLQGAMKQIVMWRVTQGEPFERDASLIVDTFLQGVLA